MSGTPPKWTGDPLTRIRVVEPNPKLDGSYSNQRYALYRTGMTVAEYVEACKATERPEYALNDITWDLERGFIELIDPK